MNTWVNGKPVLTGRVALWGTTNDLHCQGWVGLGLQGCPPAPALEHVPQPTALAYCRCARCGQNHPSADARCHLAVGLFYCSSPCLDAHHGGCCCVSLDPVRALGACHRALTAWPKPPAARAAEALQATPGIDVVTPEELVARFRANVGRLLAC